MDNLTSNHRKLSRRAQGCLLLLGSAFLSVVMITQPLQAIASSWDPTLLVNTEAFQIIDDGDGSSNIELRFGDSSNEILRWDITNSRFEFTDDLNVLGNISGSGNLTINNDGEATDAVITFGNPSGSGTITYSNANTQFEFSTGATFQGLLSGSALQIDNLSSCEVVVTAADGTLQCSSDNFMTQTEADDRYVNTSGDTMTGDLILINSAGINAQGSFTTSGGLTINDQGAGNAVLTFGGPVTQTITYNATTTRFELSSGAYIDGNLGVDGTISGTSLNVDSGNVTINGVDYSFTNTQGGSNTVLTNDGSGNLTWTSAGVGNGSGTALSLHPEYPNVSYTATGSNSVGQLRVLSAGTTSENYYNWTTSRPTHQTYDIVVRLKVPNNFAAWEVTDAVTLQYRTNTGLATDNFVQLKVYDTAGALDYDSGQLTNASTFTTQTATSADLGGTYTANSYMTVRITVMADSGDFADVGYLNVNWEVTTP